MHKGSMVYVQNIYLNKNIKQSKMTTLTSLCLQNIIVVIMNTNFKNFPIRDNW